MVEPLPAVPDWAVLAIIALSTILLTIPFVAFAPRRNTRIKIVILAAMNFAYAGIGISFSPDLTQFVGTYLVYLGVLLIGLLLGSRAFPPRERTSTVARHAAGGPAPGALAPWWSDRTATVLAAAYVVAILGQILITQGGVRVLFDPMTVILEANKGGDIFAGRIMRKETVSFTLLSYIKLFGTPFFYIELQRRLQGQWLKQLGVLLLISYLGIVAAENWGRGTFMLPLLIWLITLLFYRRISTGAFVTLLVGGLMVAAPALNAIGDWRNGVAIEGLSFGAHLERLAAKEFGYPRFYPMVAEQGASGAHFVPALLWLVGLALPGASFDGGFSTTRVLSQAVLGIRYGGSGFYVILPNWVGESLLVFGQLFWIWAFVIGAIVGAVDRLLASRPQLLTLDAFVTALMLIYIRSSAQEYVSQVVHMLTFLVLLYVISRFHVSKMTTSNE